MIDRGVSDLPDNAGASFLTVGHSTRSVEAFIEILKAHGIRTLVDVRTIPRSRHNPQFNKETLLRHLELEGIRYIHEPGLGGLRHAKKESPNGGWRNPSFRGFADYMQTAEFTEALDRLIDMAQKGSAAIMCAEAVPWRCHRSLVADALLVRGFVVEDIIGATSSKPHELTSWAKVDGKSIIYPPGPDVPIESGKRPHVEGRRKETRQIPTPGRHESRTV